ncbi:MAG: hypothetical protein GW893_15875 [Armatimonadetes bacterium]|nr:hypothetical protein [Armatimonadota bacterium]
MRRFREQEKKVPDQQVRKIAQDPSIGQEKQGELRGVCVQKFKIHTTQYLLSYRITAADTGVNIPSTVDGQSVIPLDARERQGLAGIHPR